MKNEVHEKALKLIDEELNILIDKEILSDKDREFLIKVLDKTTEISPDTNNVTIQMSDEDLLIMLSQPDKEEIKDEPIKKTNSKRAMEKRKSSVLLPTSTNTIQELFTE